jgi:HEAT repeat protein
MNTRPDSETLYQGQPLSYWIEQLQTTAADQQQRAVEILTQLGSDALQAQSALSQLTLQEDTGRRLAAARALSQFGSRFLLLLPQIRARLRQAAILERNDEARRQLLDALVHIGPQPHSRLPALVDTLKDAMPAVRMSAAEALGEMGAAGRDAIPALTAVSLYDPILRVRVEAARAIWHIDPRLPRVLPVLIDGLSDSDEMTRWIAADCLGEIGMEAEEAIPALRRALQQPLRSRLIRMSLILAMQRIDPSLQLEEFE